MNHQPTEAQQKACEYMDKERRLTCTRILEEWKLREEKRKQSKTKKK